MKKFISNIIIFVSFVLVTFTINLLVNFAIIKYENPPIANSNVLIMGDSHPQILNPDYFVSAQNVCQGAEPTVVTFWKLMYLIDKIKFDTLILGFSYHNISSFNDLKFNDKIFSPNIFLKTYPIFRYKDLKRFSLDYQMALSIYLKNMCIFPKLNHYRFIGHYKSFKKTLKRDFQEKINLHYYNRSKVPRISELSISYMDSIIKICDTYNKTLIIVSTPMHKKYFDLIPQNIKKGYKN